MDRFYPVTLKRLWFLGAVFVWLVSAAPIQAQGDSATVHLEQETIQVGAGQVEQVNIVIENGRDIYGIDLRAQFDPAVIEIADADPNKEGVQMIAGDFIKPDFLVRNQADNVAGTLQYVITQVNPTPPANGSGVVLQVLVRAKTQGASSPFTINFVEIANGKGVKLPIEPKSGTIETVAPKPPTPTRASATPVEPTPSVTVQATRAAVVATRVRATTVPARPTNGNNGELVTNVILGAVALGGCLLAVLILGLGIFLLMRKPRAVPPQFPRR